MFGDGQLTPLAARVIFDERPDLYGAQLRQSHLGRSANRRQPYQVMLQT